MRRLWVGFLSFAFVGALLAGCETTQQGNGDTTGADLTAAQQTAGRNVAVGTTTTAQLFQVAGPVQGATTAGATTGGTGTSGIRQTPPSAATVQMRLQAMLVSGTVTVTQSGALTYTIILTNVVTVTGGPAINGTVTATLTMATSQVALSSENLTVGRTTASGTVTLARTGSNALTMSANVSTTTTLDTGTTALTLTLTGPGGAGAAAITFIDASNVPLNGQLTVQPAGGTAIGATLTNLGLSSTNPYPLSGTAAFSSGGEQLTVTFNGTASVTLSDAEGHTATISLPPLA